MNTILSPLDFYWINFTYQWKFVFQNSSLFMTVVFLLLLSATCYIAKKYPAKLIPIGRITVISGLLASCITLVVFYNAFMVNYGEYTHNLVSLINTENGIQYRDLENTSIVWQGIIPPLCKSLNILFQSFFVYLVSRILYIIRTPRI